MYYVATQFMRTFGLQAVIVRQLRSRLTFTFLRWLQFFLGQWYSLKVGADFSNQNKDGEYGKNLFFSLVAMVLEMRCNALVICFPHPLTPGDG